MDNSGWLTQRVLRGLVPSLGGLWGNTFRKRQISRYPFWGMVAKWVLLGCSAACAVGGGDSPACAYVLSWSIGFGRGLPQFPHLKLEPGGAFP